MSEESEKLLGTQTAPSRLEAGLPEEERVVGATESGDVGYGGVGGIGINASPMSQTGMFRRIIGRPIGGKGRSSSISEYPVAHLNIPQLKRSATMSAKDSKQKKTQIKEPFGSPSGSQVNLLQLDPDYDTSAEYLIKVYGMLDKNGKNWLAKDEIREGLSQLDPNSELCIAIERSFLGPEEVTFPVTIDQFVQRVRDSTANMHHQDGMVSVTMSVNDFSPESVSWVHVNTEARPGIASGVGAPSPRGGHTRDQTISLAEFLEQPTVPPDYKVRWVSITGVEPSLIMRLAHKYDIHRLQLEDCMNPKHERQKVDYDPGTGVMHILLAKVSRHKPDPYSPSSLRKEQVSIFLVNESTVVYVERTASGVVEVLANRVMYAGSKIRQQNARYLVYSLVDAIVDQMFPTVEHFHHELVSLQETVHGEAATTLNVVNAIQQINRDANMFLFYIKPLKAVVMQLVNVLPGVAGDRELHRHLQDLLDHVVVLEEQTGRLITWSTSLNDDYLNEQHSRMNQVMYVLTMVTSAFLPGQFLAGVFGMNFRYMPELEWKYSYVVFWAIIAVFAAFSYNFYRTHKWLQAFQ